MIDHHEWSDTLARKTYDTRSGCDPPPIVCIPLTVCSKFGASLIFGSAVMFWSYLLSDADIQQHLSVPEAATAVRIRGIPYG